LLLLAPGVEQPGYAAVQPSPCAQSAPRSSPSPFMYRVPFSEDKAALCTGGPFSEGKAVICTGGHFSEENAALYIGAPFSEDYASLCSGGPFSEDYAALCTGAPFPRIKLLYVPGALFRG
jgi:hypothetical protein